MTTNFGRRCELTLTHPVTAGALVVLLLNDWVLKPVWQSDWTTGKLSDLAWVVFASPLLAFLLSRFMGSGRLRERSAFALAYLGLPILYAAFNTFQPLHDLILSGLLFVSGGEVGSPFDPTDSLVIPLGLALAGWVWHRSQTDTGSRLAQFHLLIAVIASFATVATSGCLPSPTAWHVGVRSDGAVVTPDTYSGGGSDSYGRYSRDGGLTWETRSRHQETPIERDQTVAWGGHSGRHSEGKLFDRGVEHRAKAPRCRRTGSAQHQLPTSGFQYVGPRIQHKGNTG